MVPRHTNGMRALPRNWTGRVILKETLATDAHGYVGVDVWESKPSHEPMPCAECNEHASYYVERWLCTACHVHAQLGA